MEATDAELYNIQNRSQFRKTGVSDSVVAYLVSAHVLMLYTINVRIIESVLCADQLTCKHSPRHESHVLVETGTTFDEDRR